MRLLDLENDLYRRLGGTATNDKTRFDAFLNETQREILRMKHFQIFRRRITTISSIANVPFMAIPRGAARLLTLMDRTNDYFLEEKSLQWLRSLDPSLRATAANPWAYVIYDMNSPVMRQPASATQLKVVSSSAADTTQKAYVDYLRDPTSFGDVFADNKTLNGITNVNLSFADAVSVDKFLLDGAAAGNVTLLDGSGNTLAIIPIGKLFSRYTLLHLYPLPSAAQTYYADVEVHIEDMAQPNDEPLIPEDFHHLIGVGARIKEYEKREKWNSRLQLINSDWTPGLKKMQDWVNRQTGIIGGASTRRYSQLGAWFEPGT